ncbi:MAG TPA: MaoC family dehydratase [Burkholderiaceae bacterium]|nr:MaoC family dehydratase [Burkholderiaceae bacterium]
MTIVNAPAGAFAEWLALPPGFRFPDVPLRIDRQRQRRNHLITGVDDDLFGDRVNAGVLTDVISQSVHAVKLPIDGRVLLGLQVQQRTALSIGQDLIGRGRIDALVSAPRGHLLTCSYHLIAADQPASAPPPVSIRNTMLLLDPSTPRAAPGARPVEDPLAGFTRSGRCTMTPEAVRAYCAEIGNLIHFDEEYARARGYRAPIAPRLLDVTILVAELRRAHGDRSAPFAFDLDLRVHRPLFWDETLDTWIRRAGDSFEFRLVTGDGRITSAATATLGTEPRSTRSGPANPADESEFRA